MEPVNVQAIVQQAIEEYMRQDIGAARAGLQDRVAWRSGGGASNSKSG